MNDEFYLDIFNKLIKINENDVMFIFDENYEIWFGLKDVFKVLGYKGMKNIVSRFKLDDKYKTKFSDLKVPTSMEVPLNIQPTQIFINESGLYQVLSKSDMPLAKVFMEKYFSDIMIQIRKTGKYTSTAEEFKKLNKINKELKKYIKEANYYEKYIFEPSANGYFYILYGKIYKDGKKIICYKIGYAKKMSDRLSNYRVGNFSARLIAYVPLKIDRKQLETCIKNKLKPHLVKLKTDLVCYVSLDDLKHEITNCINELVNHICICTICSKKYGFNKIDQHECYTDLETNIIDVTDVLDKINTRQKSKSKSKSKSKTKPKTKSKSKAKSKSKSRKIIKNSNKSKILNHSTNNKKVRVIKRKSKSKSKSK